MPPTEPSLASFIENMRRAWGTAAQGAGRALRATGRAYSGGLMDGPAPSRDAVRSMASHDEPDPKDVDRSHRESFAATQAARSQAGEPPRNVVTQERGSGAPSDPPARKMGTGTDLQPLVSNRYPGESSTWKQGARGGARATVRLPDGTEALRGPEGVDEATGAAGSVYMSTVQPSPAGHMTTDETAAIGLPTDEDRSPGWAARAAYRELYSSGDLSMDPRDIMDRRRFEEQETARDMMLERAQAEHAAALSRSMVDPTEMARIEAEGRYGGQALTQEAQAMRIQAALVYYAQLSEQINAVEREMSSLEPESPDYQALSQTRDRLVQERREMPNLALGFKLQDPKLDPLSALVGLVGAGAPAAGGGGG